MRPIGVESAITSVVVLFALMAVDGPAQTLGIARAPISIGLMILATLAAWWYEWRRGYGGYRLLVFAALILAVAILRWPADGLPEWLTCRLH